MSSFVAHRKCDISSKNSYAQGSKEEKCTSLSSVWYVICRQQASTHICYFQYDNFPCRKTFLTEEALSTSKSCTIEQQKVLFWRWFLGRAKISCEEAIPMEELTKLWHFAAVAFGIAGRTDDLRVDFGRPQDLSLYVSSASTITRTFMKIRHFLYSQFYPKEFQTFQLAKMTLCQPCFWEANCGARFCCFFIGPAKATQFHSCPVMKNVRGKCNEL